jgi:hypothetical protein
MCQSLQGQPVEPRRRKGQTRSNEEMKKKAPQTNRGVGRAKERMENQIGSTEAMNYKKNNNQQHDFFAEPLP